MGHPGWFNLALPKLYVEQMYPKTPGAVASLALLKIRSPVSGAAAQLHHLSLLVAAVIVSSNSDGRREMLSCRYVPTSLTAFYHQLPVCRWKSV